MTEPKAPTGLTSSPIVAVLIGFCSLGLLGFGAWRALSGNRDWWMLGLDALLGVAGVLFAVDVFRGPKSPSAGDERPKD
jgi:hypothetical protein